MRAIDRKKYHSESLEFLKKLNSCDPNRIGYYHDLSNKWSIEDRLEDWIRVLSTNREAPIDLSNLHLNNLHYKQYLCVADEINLAANYFEPKRFEEIFALLSYCNVKFTLEDLSNV